MDYVHVPAAELKDSKYHIRMLQNPKCHFPLNFFCSMGNGILDFAAFGYSKP
jgi:hypothetical protein